MSFIATGDRPLIIIGMHRSGTSLVARCLEQAGLFMGRQKDGNNEALFFLRLNTWLFSQCGGRWDYPLPVLDLIGDPDARAGVEEYLEFMLKTPRAASFLGWPQYLRWRSIKHIKRPWGWKDPRNTFTLPFWLTVFPAARVLHVYRHGIDVASSLAVRRNKTVPLAAENFRKRKLIHFFLDKKSGFSQSSRCSCIAGGVEVWQEYMAMARRQTTTLGDKALDVCYEEFLENPVEILHNVARFAGFVPDEERLANVVKGISKDRAYAYRRAGGLVAEAQKIEPLLAEFGYEA